jgi:hypothetical protein
MAYNIRILQQARLFGVCLLVLLLISPSHAATSFNAHSAMGMNLADLTYFASEQPFINYFASAERWITHSKVEWDTHEEQYLNLDANGWPISLTTVNQPIKQKFDSLGVLFLLGMPNTENGFYTAGQYAVLYDGQGKLDYGLDATLIRRSPGRDVISVIPSNKGIDLRIVSTDPRHKGNYLRTSEW